MICSFNFCALGNKTAYSTDKSGIYGGHYAILQKGK